MDQQLSHYLDILRNSRKQLVECNVCTLPVSKINYNRGGGPYATCWRYHSKIPASASQFVATTHEERDQLRRHCRVISTSVPAISKDPRCNYKNEDVSSFCDEMILMERVCSVIRLLLESMVTSESRVTRLWNKRKLLECYCCFLRESSNDVIYGQRRFQRRKQ